MGLDIYLYTRDEAAQNKAHSDASEALYDRADYDALTDDEKRDAWKALPGYASQVDVPSERYPDHLFNRRYLRSSYNGGGFNNAVPSLVGEDHGLNWIFEPMGREWDGDEGTLTPDDLPKLRESKARALQVADELRKSDRLRVMTASPNMFMAPPTTTDDEALALYRSKVADGSIRPDGWWSNRDMDVFGDGVSVLAAIPGQATFGVPGVHLIYRSADKGLDSYVQSAEIVGEFCDEAISLIERDGSCLMSWSG